MRPNRVGPHVRLKNPVHNWVAKSIKYSLLFSSFGDFSDVLVFVAGGMTNRTTDEVFGVFFRVELQTLAKLFTSPFFLSPCGLFNKSTSLLPTTQAERVVGWGMHNHLFKSHCHN